MAYVLVIYVISINVKIEGEIPSVDFLCKIKLTLKINAACRRGREKHEVVKWILFHKERENNEIYTCFLILYKSISPLLVFLGVLCHHIGRNMAGGGGTNVFTAIRTAAEKIPLLHFMIHITSEFLYNKHFHHHVVEW